MQLPVIILLFVACISLDADANVLHRPMMVVEYYF
jgi:hypothetical protein